MIPEIITIKRAVPECLGEVVEILSQTGHQSKSVDEFINQKFDIVITVCDNAKETCPMFPGNAERIHHSFDDPPASDIGCDEERLSIFRRVRDEIRIWMKDFISEHSLNGKVDILTYDSRSDI